MEIEAPQPVPSQTRRRLLTLLLINAIVLTLVSPFLELANEAAFMDFADKRTFFGIANTGDVLSNFGFLLASLFGLKTMARLASREPSEKILRDIGTFVFASVLLTFGGSVYFHLRPTHETLFWDRLPMAFGFASLIALLVADRISVEAGRILAVALTIVGSITIYIWQVHEIVKPYAAFQAGAVLTTAVIAVLYPRGRIANLYVVLSCAGYAFAKVLEFWDRPIFEMTGFVSGHSLKHLVAALAIYALAKGFESPSTQQ